LKQILDANYIPTSLSHNFTVIDSFTYTNGKFGDALGNAALIDCHHAKWLLISTYEKFYRRFLDRNTFYYLFANQVDKSARAMLDSIDFCNYALSLGGVIANQVETYAGGIERMEQKVGEAGNLMIDALT